MAEPYIIRISSQKGGVGKTVIATNLAASIRALGYKVLIIDTDFTNPSVGVYLGIEDVNIGFREVVAGKADLHRAIVPHYASGLSVIPGVITSKQFQPTKAQIDSAIKKLQNLNFDFIIVDTEPGYIIPQEFKMYNEAIIVTTPEMSSCLSAVKLSHIYDREKLKHNLVVNRVKNKRYEISIGEIEEIYEDRVEAVLPEDETVPISIAQHIPAYNLNKRSAFGKGIGALARFYSGRATVEQTDTRDRTQKTGGFFAFLRRIFRMR